MRRLPLLLSLLFISSTLAAAQGGRSELALEISEVFSLRIEYPTEFSTCREYRLAIEVKALEHVHVNQLRIDVLCVDGCTTVLRSIVLLEDVDLSQCEIVTDCLKFKCCRVVTRDPYIVLRVWANLTHCGIAECYKLEVPLGPLRDLTYRQLRESYEELVSRYEELSEKYEELEEQYSALVENYEEISSSYESQARALAEMEELYRGLLDEYEKLRECYEELKRAYEGLEEAYNRTLEERGILASKYEEASKELAYFEGKYEELKRAYDELSRKYSLANADLAKTKEILWILAAALGALAAISALVLYKQRREGGERVPPPPPPPQT